jgi:hypothetical protein
MYYAILLPNGCSCPLFHAAAHNIYCVTIFVFVLLDQYSPQEEVSHCALNRGGWHQGGQDVRLE